MDLAFDMFIPQSQENIVKFVCDGVNSDVMYHFKDNEPTISHKECVFEFCTNKNLLESIYYTNFCKPDNPLLQVERQIVLKALIAILFTTNELDKIDDTSIEVASHMKTIAALEKMVDISNHLQEHKNCFEMHYPSNQYFFSNKYVKDISFMLKLAAQRIAIDVKNILGVICTPESILDFTAFHNPKLKEIIYLKVESKSIKTCLNEIPK